MESNREEERIYKDEKIKEILSDNELIKLLDYLIEEDKKTFKDRMEKTSNDDFYKEAMDMLIAKGGCIALEQFKLKLINYAGLE